ncbi:hypothetical protein AB6Q56_09665 [Dechloromonas sp. ARDL1]|uniref:hypothetical protein n=1 Tax=Dechloromonas sp. ARDL1 TaxID=3322121 RepID=UPI003DA77E10
MTRLFAWLAGALLLLVLAAGGLMAAALESKPLVERSESISPATINQARRLFHANDPRRLREGESRRTVIPATLIDEGINALAGRALKARGAFILTEDAAEIRLTRRVPLISGAAFLNLQARIRQGDGGPKISTAAIGPIPIPPFILEAFLAIASRAGGYGTEWQLARQAIHELAFDPRRRLVIVGYTWEPALLDRARTIAFSPDDLVRIRSAQESLAALLDHHAPERRIPLANVLQATLDVEGSDQRKNRRAAMLVLGVYLGGKNIASLIPEARGWSQLRPVTMMLSGRNDSAQHFAVSAMLAAWAGEPVADAIGLYKELADARHGSGFSFADLAADRAGTRFGELLNREDRRLDTVLNRNIHDRDLVPPLGDLPESIGATEFQRHFGSTASPAYRQLTAEIERRLDSMPLYEPQQP